MRFGNIDSPDIVDTTSQIVHSKFIDDYTKLLLHGDGANASQTIIDSAKNKTVTAVSDAAVSTAQSKFGGGSLLFDGGDDYMTVPDSDDFYFGTADFTIDFWVRFNSMGATNQTYFMIQDDGAFEQGIAWQKNNNQWEFFAAFTDNNYVDVLAPDTITTGVWYHVACVRSGDNFYVFRDGVLKGSGTKSGSLKNFTSTLKIGVYQTGPTHYLDGNIDEYRISKGIARWTAAFTPPIQSYDCTLDTQTKLLIHGGGPNNSVAFYDNSTTARTLTTVSDTKYDSSQYKFRVSSIKFDGAGDYLTVPDSADWAFGTGNLTIDFWVRFNNLPANNTGAFFFAQEVDYTTYTRMYLWNTSGSYSFIFYSTAGIGQTVVDCEGTFAVSTNTWYHVALVKYGNNYTMFVNGTSIGTTVGSLSYTLPDLAAVLQIGRGHTEGTNYYLDGWLDEYRVSKGIARWVSNFTPPIAPYDSPLSQYVVDGLNGDVDKEYRIVSYLVNGSAGACQVFLRPNNDTTEANYGFQLLYGSDSSAGSTRVTNVNRQIVSSNASSRLGFSDLILYAKSGKVRTMIIKQFSSINGTSITEIDLTGQVWNNTIDNITSLTMAADQLNAIGAGSLMVLLKKKQLTSGVKTGEIDPGLTVNGLWQLVDNYTVAGSAATSHTISGLNGDKDVLYRLVVRNIAGVAGGENLCLRFNSDSAANYGRQFLRGVSTTVTAARYTADSTAYLSFGTSSGKIEFSDSLIHCKSGSVRAVLTNFLSEVSGTSAGENSMNSSVWNNSTDNVTSLTVFSDIASGLGVGCHIELWRLNL